MAPPLPNTIRRRRAVGLAFAVVGLHIWRGENRGIENREGGGVLALGGAAVQSRHPTINQKSAEGIGGTIEGRRAERQVRERALMYRLGAAN